MKRRMRREMQNVCISLRKDQIQFLETAKKFEKIASVSEFFRRLIDLYGKQLIETFENLELTFNNHPELIQDK